MAHRLCRLQCDFAHGEGMGVLLYKGKVMMSATIASTGSAVLKETSQDKSKVGLAGRNEGCDVEPFNTCS